MQGLSGTWQLVRLILRLDRIKLPLWIGATAGIIAVGFPALKDIYGGTQELLVYANTTASSVVARLLGGPIDGPNIGSVLMIEYFLFASVLAAFMSTLLVVRHTRQNEEMGRTELIGSLVVGRHAQLAAALIVAVGANIVLGALVVAALGGHNLPFDGTLAMAIGIAGVGVSFAAIAGCIAQITESARSANAIAAATIGGMVLVRGIGDAIGTVAQNGLSVASAWPAWLSPFGWGQQMHPFGALQFWPTFLFVALFAGASALALRMISWRDVGSGLRATKSGPASAGWPLRSNLGLGWRLQRGIYFGWAVGLVIMGVILGITSVEFRDLFTENEQFAQIFEALAAGGANFYDIYFGGMMAFSAILIAGYGLHALQRLRSEESGGQLEQLLATSLSRFRWLVSHVGIAALGVISISVLFGISLGISFVLVADTAWAEVPRLVLAALVQVPAIIALTGGAALFFGLIPRLATTLAWTAFAFCLVVIQLRVALDLPQWAVNMSPFTHTPPAPANDIALTPLVWLSAVAAGLTVAALVTFRNRDLAP